MNEWMNANMREKVQAEDGPLAGVSQKLMLIYEKHELSFLFNSIFIAINNLLEKKWSFGLVIAFNVTTEISLEYMSQ